MQSGPSGNASTLFCCYVVHLFVTLSSDGVPPYSRLSVLRSVVAAPTPRPHIIDTYHNMTTALLEPGAPTLASGAAPGDAGASKRPGASSKVVLKHSPTLLFDILVSAVNWRVVLEWSLPFCKGPLQGFARRPLAAMPSTPLFPPFIDISRASHTKTSPLPWSPDRAMDPAKKPRNRGPPIAVAALQTLP